MYRSAKSWKPGVSGKNGENKGRESAGKCSYDFCGNGWAWGRDGEELWMGSPGIDEQNCSENRSAPNRRCAGIPWYWPKSSGQQCDFMRTLFHFNETCERRLLSLILNESIMQGIAASSVRLVDPFIFSMLPGNQSSPSFLFSNKNGSVLKFYPSLSDYFSVFN